MHPALSEVDHRPWPCPRSPWTWRQSWRDLAFLHWPVPVGVLRPHVPDGLRIEKRDGAAWLGVVPFRMAGVMRRPLPDLPGISAFPELNVRTYVDVASGPSRPGVWFFSLDATNRLAVWAARTFFHLPYHRAAITLEERRGVVDYRSERDDGRAAFEAAYRPTGDVELARPGSFEHWSTERYCLYALSPRRGLLRAEVHHRQWPLQPCEAEVRRLAMTPDLGIDLEGPPATSHFARRVDVVVWSPEPVA